MIQSSSCREPVEVLAEEFLQLRRSGVQISIETFALQHAELADEIRDYFPAVLILETLAPPSQSQDGPPRIQSPATLPAEFAAFEIKSEIGRGAMGVVYEARQQSLQRQVALKIMSPGVLQSPAQVERFEREAHLAAKLHHTNIVPVFERGRCEDTHYFAMQLIEGPSLDKLIARGGAPITPRSDKRFITAARMGQQIAEALEYAHGQGVVHRDIKPANVLVDESGNVWITDFGLAKATENASITSPGSAVGTLRYMAPEQIEGHSDPASDIYSLGATLYEILTGKPAFEGDNRAALVAAISAGSFMRPRRLNPDIPRDLENIVCKAMATSPGCRYSSAQSLADDLQRFSNHQPVKAGRISTLQHVSKWARRKPQAAALATASLVMFLLALSSTTMGYFYTARALVVAKEEQHRALAATKSADEHRLQAEDNLAIALRALREISAEASGGPQQSGVEQNDWGQLGVVSPEVRNIMQTTLDFHRELVARNHHRSDLTAGFARVLAQTGEVHQRFGDYEAADRSYQQALTLFQGLEDRGCSDLMRCDSFAIVLKLAGLKRLAGEFQEAEALYFSVRPQILRVLENQPESTHATFRLAEFHFELSKLYHAQGSVKKWSRENSKAVKLLEDLNKVESGNPAYQFLLAQAYGNCAPFRPGDNGETAQVQYRKAIAILKSLAAANPETPGFRYELAKTYARVHIWRPQGHRRKEPVGRDELIAAQKRLRAALRISRELTHEHPRVPSFFEASADQMTQLAHVYALLGEVSQARHLYDRAVLRAESLVQMHPSSAHHHNTLACTLFWQGQFVATQGDVATARDLVVRSVEERRIFLKTAPAQPRSSGMLRDQLKWLESHPIQSAANR